VVTASESAPAVVQSVDRAVTVLEILAAHDSVGVSEIATELGVHRSTAFRLLGALEARDLVEQVVERGRYRLSVGLLRLASAVRDRLDVVAIGHSICQALADRCGETVNIAVRRGEFALNVDQALAGTALAVRNWIGRPTQLYATSSGKLLLAYLPHEQATQLLGDGPLARLTAQTLSRTVLLRQLKQIRRDGWAMTFEELEPGLNAVAAPVRDDTGDVVAAVTVSGPAFRLAENQLHATLADLVAAADEISAGLGHHN